MVMASRSDASSVVLRTNTPLFLTSISTPVLGLDPSDWYVQSRERLDSVLEEMVSPDTDSGRTIELIVKSCSIL